MTATEGNTTHYVAWGKRVHRIALDCDRITVCGRRIRSAVEPGITTVGYWTEYNHESRAFCRQCRRRLIASRPDPLRSEAFKRYGETGEVAGLAALADALDERGETLAFARLLRKVAATANPAVLFFYQQSGWVDRAHRIKSAVALAKAEEWFECNEWQGGDREKGVLQFRWTTDAEGDDDAPDFAWGAILERFDPNGHVGMLTDDAGWETVASAWGVTFGGDGHPDGDPYARVVRAELAMEAMPD